MEKSRLHHKYDSRSVVNWKIPELDDVSDLWCRLGTRLFKWNRIVTIWIVTCIAWEILSASSSNYFVWNDAWIRKGWKTVLEGKRIGLGITASHCTYEDVVPKIAQFREAGATVVPIITPSVLHAATRFGTGEEWIAKIEEYAGEKVLIWLPIIGKTCRLFSLLHQMNTT